MSKEIRVTCLSCGFVYHYDKFDVIDNFGKKCDNAAQFFGGLAGNAIGARNKEKTIDFNMCQKCGSRNIKKENIVFNVEKTVNTYSKATNPEISPPVDPFFGLNAKIEELKNMKPAPDVELALLYQQAQQSNRERKYKDAIVLLEEILKRDSNYYKAWGELNHSYYMLNLYEKAVDCSLNAIKINSDDYSIWANLASTFQALLRYKEALQAVEKSISINPQYSFSWQTKGCILMAIGKNEDAIKAFNASLRYNASDRNTIQYKKNAKKNIRMQKKEGDKKSLLHILFYK